MSSSGSFSSLALFFLFFGIHVAISEVKINSGVMRLIVKTYIDELLAMSKIEDEFARSKLIDLGNHISSHPALNQKHLYVGQEPPDFDPDRLRSGRHRSLESIHKRNDGNSGTEGVQSSSLTASDPIDSTLSAGSSPGNQQPFIGSDVVGQDKVSKSQFPSEEICTTDRQWEQINETNDFYDNKVQIVQEDGLQQFVFTYRCANAKGACTGISNLYHSECTERFGWIYMYYRKSPSDAPQWGYVAAPHHCACKIQPNPVTQSPRKK